MARNGNEPETTSPGRRYHLRALVGRGAFGEVYLAEQDSGSGFRRKVAVKVLNADMAQMKEASRRIRDEARILGRLSHRNIVAVSDLCVLDDRWAVIMDYVPGADIEMIIEALHATSGTMPTAAALEIGAAICSALDAAHNATDDDGVPLAIVHRDIKPSNVRVSPDGEVKVLDFGVARVDMDTREAKTRAQGMIGTERYMAPERILLDGDTPAGDVYAAAATVLEMLQLLPLGRTPVLVDRHTAFVAAALESCRATLSGPEDVVNDILSVLGSALDHEGTVRPTAAALSESLTRLARRLESEPLAVFARRFVPQVEAILNRAPAPATGILAEMGAGVSAEAGPGATLAQFTGAPPDEPIAKKSSSSKGILVLLGSISVLAGIAAIGLIVFGATRTEVPVASTAAPSNPVPAVVSEPPVIVAPAPQVIPNPAEVVVTPQAAPTTARPRPAEPAIVSSPQPAVVLGPPIEKALVALRDASSLEVSCGGSTVAGTAAVRLRNIPPGPCQVVAMWLGQRYTTQITIDRPREFQCAVADGVLRCT